MNSNRRFQTGGTRKIRSDRNARREKASALLGRPVAVRFALKNQVSNLGKDPMDALVQFGEQHSDIFTIK